MAPQETPSARMEKIEARLDRLEDWRAEANTRAALDAQQAAYYKQRFDKIDEELQEIKSVAWRVIWVVVGSFAASFVAWIIQGGLKLG